MQFIAKARRLAYSPYKLRPIVDVIRGKDVVYALSWLATYNIKRTVPVKKIIESAAANAKNLQNVAVEDLRVKEIKVDEGRRQRYFKPGSMGRANLQTKRFCHMSIVLESKVAVKEV